MLRRIIRRAIRHGYQLGQKQPFFHKLVEDLDRQMGDAYPELRRDKARVAQVLKAEEERFGETIENGMRILGAALANALAKARRQGARRRDRVHAVRHVRLPARPHGGRCARPRRHGRRGRLRRRDGCAARARARRVAVQDGRHARVRRAEDAFRGYETLSEEGRVVALYKDGAKVDALTTGEQGVVVLDRTPFYAESGGQVGDRGELTKGGVCLTLFAVEDTQKVQPDVFGHVGEVKTGELRVGDTVAAEVDHDARGRTMRNHSATHLMHKALREVLGSHVQQKGSLVDPDKTRFDFAHNAPMTDDEIRRVEEIVNAEILDNQPTNARVMPIDEAQKLGAMMLFGEKYGDRCACSTSAARASCAAARTSRAPATSVFSRSSPRAASRRASAASRR